MTCLKRRISPTSVSVFAVLHQHPASNVAEPSSDAAVLSVQLHRQIFARQACCMAQHRTAERVYQHDAASRRQESRHGLRDTSMCCLARVVSEGAFDDDLDEDEAGDPEEPRDDDEAVDDM